MELGIYKIGELTPDPRRRKHQELRRPRPRLPAVRDRQPSIGD
jgi:hypothetical protein